MRYSDDEKRQLREILLARTARHDFPIVADMDFGHTAPQLTLPLGVAARIDSTRELVTVLEPCTA
jgi:muramoyltetrapeptide carboxypeptidase